MGGQNYKQTRAGISAVPVILFNVFVVVVVYIKILIFWRFFEGNKIKKARGGRSAPPPHQVY